MTLKDDEAVAKAKLANMLADLNSTEATWLAWLKAHKVAAIIVAVILVLFVAYKLV